MYYHNNMLANTTLFCLTGIRYLMRVGAKNSYAKVRSAVASQRGQFAVAVYEKGVSSRSPFCLSGRKSVE